METGKVLKLESADSGIVFYRITSTEESSYTIKPLCKVRKGFLTVKYRNVNESRIYKSEVGVNYLVASRREINRLKEILDETVDELDQVG
jgi:hypothetical protein